MIGYVEPEYNKQSFTCPFCGVLAAQSWVAYGHVAIHSCRCLSCGEATIWLDRKMIWPLTGNAPIPNGDMPEPAKEIYFEARSIAGISPRGAAALLRLAIDLLTTHLGAEGKTLDLRIQDLVNKGLDVQVQQMLDSVRAIGNDAVHPGEIRFDEAPELLQTLFWLVNEIVEERITKPKRVTEAYSLLTAGQLEGIANREKKTQAKAQT